MPKQKTTTPKTGKRQQKGKNPTNQGGQRLTASIARAISSDAVLLEEIQSLLPQKETIPQMETVPTQMEVEPPQPNMIFPSTSSQHIDDQEQPDTSEIVDLGAFSSVHPPVDKATRQKKL